MLNVQKLTGNQSLQRYPLLCRTCTYCLSQSWPKSVFSARWRQEDSCYWSEHHLQAGCQPRILQGMKNNPLMREDSITVDTYLHILRTNVVMFLSGLVVHIRINNPRCQPSQFFFHVKEHKNKCVKILCLNQAHHYGYTDQQHVSSKGPKSGDVLRILYRRSPCQSSAANLRGIALAT